MLQFVGPVKFIGVETKTGVSKKTGKDYAVTEATLFVPDLGRVKVPVKGSPKYPAVGSTVNLMLSADQGSFQSLRVQWDENSQFKAA